MATSKKVRLEVDAPGVHKDSVDTLGALELGLAYFKALQAIAADRGTEIEFRGLDVVEKCLRIEAETFEPVIVKHAIRELARNLEDDGIERPQFLEATRRALKPFRDATKIEASVDDYAVELPVPTRRPRTQPTMSTMSCRAKVISVGGSKQLGVTLRTDGEPEDFRLAVKDADQARLAGANIHGPVEIRAVVRRDGNGLIVSGSLEACEAVIEGDAVEAWKAWFAANTAEFATAADALEAMRGDDADDSSSLPGGEET